jgi:MFS family permease
LSGSPEKATHAAVRFDSSPLPHKAVLYLLVAMQVTHIVDFMVLMPLGGSLMKLFSLTPTQFSLAVGSYTFAAGVSGLLIAGFADRFDRKKLLLVAYGGLAFATLACALAPNFATLVTARIFAGIFGGVMSGVVYAIVGDLIPPSHRGRAMGLVGVSFPLAATIGVPFSLFIATHLFDWRAPFIALFIICAALWWFAWAKLPNVQNGARKSPDAYGVECVQKYESPQCVWLDRIAYVLSIFNRAIHCAGVYKKRNHFRTSTALRLRDWWNRYVFFGAKNRRVIRSIWPFARLPLDYACALDSSPHHYEPTSRSAWNRILGLGAFYGGHVFPLDSGLRPYH